MHAPVTPLIPDPETMTDAEYSCLRQALASSVQYLEYGAGASTCLAARLTSVRHIVSVESDAGYIDLLRREHDEIRRAEETGRLRFHLADLGPTEKWGSPRDHTKKDQWPAYTLGAYPGNPIPDTILIDGRFRVACGLQAALTCPPSTTLLIHDYRERLQYHLLEQVLDIEKAVDRFVVCHPKERFNRSRAERLLRLYLLEPRDADPLPFARFRFRWKSRFHRARRLFSTSGS